MQNLLAAVAVMAANDLLGGSRDADGRRRQYTVEELDALAEFTWPWASLKSRLASGVNAILVHMRPRARIRIEATVLPSADATARV